MEQKNIKGANSSTWMQSFVSIKARITNFFVSRSALSNFFQAFLMFIVVLFFFLLIGPSWNYIVDTSSHFKSPVYIDGESGKFVTMDHQELIQYYMHNKYYYVLSEGMENPLSIPDVLYPVDAVDASGDLFATIDKTGILYATVPVNLNQPIIVSEAKEIYNYNFIIQLYEYYQSWPGRLRGGLKSLIKYFISSNGIDYIIGGAFGALILEFFKLIPAFLFTAIRRLCNKRKQHIIISQEITNNTFHQ